MIIIRDVCWLLDGCNRPAEILCTYLMGRCARTNPQGVLAKTRGIADGTEPKGAEPDEGRRSLAVQGIAGNAHAYPYRADASCLAGVRSSYILHVSLQHRKQR